MKDYDLRRLQLTEYEMLKDVTKFCDDNGITYFLIYGTLIGAMRHGGFIPWDDDIDICMDVKNYKKFIKLAPKGLPSKYFVQNFKTEKKFDSKWTKVRINGTSSMEKAMTNLDIHFGISMDIFIINGISNSNFRKKIQSRAVKLQNELLLKYYFIEGEIPIKNSKRFFYYYKLPEFIRRFLISFLDNIILIDRSKCDLCYNTFDRRLSNCKKLKSKWFDETEKAKFEDEYFSIPKDYDEILTTVYGEWRKVPPESERVDHGEMYIDFENDYSIYIGEKLRAKKQKRKNK